MRSNIHTLNRVNLYEQVADYMEQMILDAKETQWEAGGKLPSEQELADRFGVSRNVVREAIKLLKERGLVDPRNGVGAYVTKPESQQMSAMIYRYVLMDGIDIAEIYDTRILIEEHCAYEAAARCTDEDLREMRALLDKMEDRTISADERRETDYQFHIAIAKAAGNPLNLLMIESFKDVFLAMIEKGIFVPGGIVDASARHEKIMKALVAHDCEGAKQAMIEHLTVSLEHVKDYNNQRK